MFNNFWKEVFVRTPRKETIEIMVSELSIQNPTLLGTKRRSSSNLKWAKIREKLSVIMLSGGLSVMRSVVRVT